MIERQLSMNLSEYAGLYDAVVPEDHLLRQINDLVDFSFIYDELKEKYCHDNGRNAVHPIRMFKYLLLKTIYTLSDVDLVERTKVDMSFKYFLEMAPEDDVIDPSLLTHFRRKRLEDETFLDLLINKTVAIAIEKDIIQSSAIIVDATHTKARYNQCTPQEILRQRSKNVRKAIYSVDDSMKDKFPEKPKTDELEEEIEYTKKLVDVITQEPTLTAFPKIKEPFNLLKETVDDHQEFLPQSPDSDARVGYKSADSSFYGYKTHLGMNEERLITAATITTGEKSDGKYLTTLIEKSEQAGVKVDTVMGDAAYSEKENLSYTNEKEITLVSKLNPTVTHGTRTKEKQFDFNKDAGMYVCPAGHIAIHKRQDSRKASDNKNSRVKFFFDIEKCKTCPLREGCYTEGAKSKTYSVTLKSHEHQEQEEFQKTEDFKEKAKERYKIEAKNSELKHRLGYEVASSSGLEGMHIQGAMAIFTANVKRILKLSKS